MPTWPILLRGPSQNLMKVLPFVCIIEKWKSWKFQLFWPKGLWDMTLRNFDLFQHGGGGGFGLWPFFIAYSPGGRKAMNLTFSLLNDLTKDWQKTDICGNLCFTWLPYWMSKIQERKHFFWFLSYFSPQIPAKLSKYTKYL